MEGDSKEVLRLAACAGVAGMNATEVEASAARGDAQHVAAVEEDDDDDDYCLGFVFEDWLDPETLTCHDASEFSFEELGVRVAQGAFEHTPENDQTGAVVWDDAVMLCRHLTAHTGPLQAELSGKRVIDMGCGTGFLGIAVAAGCAARVVVTDRPVMRDLVSANVERNRDVVKAAGGECHFEAHSWGEPLAGRVAAMAPFDVVLVSGCIYHEEANPLLLQSLKLLGDERTTIYLAIDFRFEVQAAFRPEVQAQRAVAARLAARSSQPTKVLDRNPPASGVAAKHTLSSGARNEALDGSDEEQSDGAAEDEEQYITPVVASFLRQAVEAGLVIQTIPRGSLAMAPDQIKASVVIMECKWPKTLSAGC